MPNKEIVKQINFGEIKDALGAKRAPEEYSKKLLDAAQKQFDAVLADASLSEDKAAEKLNAIRDTFLQLIGRIDSNALAQIERAGGDFVAGVEGVAQAPEGDEKPADAPAETVKQVERSKRDAEQRAVKRVESKKKRELKAALRAVKKDSLEMQKKKYQEMKTVEPSRKYKLLDKVDVFKKESVEKQLAIYKEAFGALENVPEEYVEEVNGLKSQLEAFGAKPSLKEPNLGQLKDKMDKARTRMGSTPVIVLDAPLTFENVKDNFNKIASAQQDIDDTSNYLQALMGYANKEIAKGQKAAENYDIFDSFWPSDTERNLEVGKANLMLKAKKADIATGYNPALREIEKYKDVVLAAANDLSSQGQDLYSEKMQAYVDAGGKKEEILNRFNLQSTARTVEAKNIFELNVEVLKREQEEKLAIIRERQQQILALRDGQTQFIENQKQILDEEGQNSREKLLNHDELEDGLNKAIETLEAKKQDPSLSDAQKEEIEKRIVILNENKSDASESKNYFQTEVKAVVTSSQKLTVAGEDVKVRVNYALLNLDSIENKTILDFAQKISGMQSTFETQQQAMKLSAVAGLEDLTENLDENIAVAEDEQDAAFDIKETADLQHLELEVANMSTVETLKNQRDQMLAQEEIGGGSVVDVAWNTLSLKRVFNGAYDLMGLKEDNWFRKNLDGIGIALPVALMGGLPLGLIAGALPVVQDGILAAAHWIDEKTGVADWYHATIEKAKNIDTPFVGQVAEIGAGLVDFVVDLGAGVGQLALNTRQSIKGIVDLVKNPSRLGEVGKALLEVEEFENGNAFFGMTKIAGNILLTATGAGAAGAGLRAASASTGVFNKMGQFVRIASIDFARTAPRALMETGGFLIKTPFRVASGALKVGVGAMKGEFFSLQGASKTLSVLRRNANIRKVGELSAKNEKLMSQMQKLLPEILPEMLFGKVDKIEVFNKEAILGIFEDSKGMLANSPNWAYGKLLRERYIANAERMTKLESTGQKSAVVAEEATLVDDAVRTDQATLVDTPLADQNLTLRAEAKVSNLERFQKAQDIVVDFDSNPALKAELAKYRTKFAGKNFGSVDDLTYELLDDVNVKGIERTAPYEVIGYTDDFKGGAGISPWKLEDVQISIYKAMAKQLFEEKTALAAAEEAAKAVKAAEAAKEAEAAAKFADTNKGKLADLKLKLDNDSLSLAEKAETLEQISNLEWKVVLENGFDWTKANGSLALKFVRNNGLVDGVLNFTGFAGKAALGLAEYTAKGLKGLAAGTSYVFGLDSATELGMGLREVFKRNKALPDFRYRDLFNGAGDIEFVVRNQPELNAAIVKLGILIAHMDDEGLIKESQTELAKLREAEKAEAEKAAQLEQEVGQQ